MLEKRIRDRKFISEYKELAGHIISPKMELTKENFDNLIKKINELEKKFEETIEDNIDFPPAIKSLYKHVNLLILHCSTTNDY